MENLHTIRINNPCPIFKSWCSHLPKLTTVIVTNQFVIEKKSDDSEYYAHVTCKQKLTPEQTQLVETLIQCLLKCHPSDTECSVPIFYYETNPVLDKVAKMGEQIANTAYDKSEPIRKGFVKFANYVTPENSDDDME